MQQLDMFWRKMIRTGSLIRVSAWSSQNRLRSSGGLPGMGW
jgi:hypothetical protein